jgi:queuosine precursor transporter
MTTTTLDPTPRYAVVGSSHYPTTVAVFVALLIISNVCATKLIAFGPIITDGGALLFPLTYVIGDILGEVYGLKPTQRAIYLGFAMLFLAALTFWIVGLAPPAAAYEHQDAFVAVLGFVPRIVAASLAGYLVGQTLNALVLVKIKERTKEKKLWLRLVGSTLIGQFADTLVFCFVAFFGVITGWEFVNYVVVGYVYKCLVEIALLPVTYRVIAAVKKSEPTYQPMPDVGADGFSR